jgi:hypothetical protein
MSVQRAVCMMTGINCVMSSPWTTDASRGTVDADGWG